MTCDHCGCDMPEDRRTFKHRYCSDACREIAFRIRRHTRIKADPTPGFLYVLALSTGRIKIGRTSDLGQRVEAHRYAASMYGARVTREWTSERVDDMLQAEFDLLTWCMARGTPEPAARETFTGLAWDDVVIRAAQLTTGRKLDG